MPMTRKLAFCMIALLAALGLRAEQGMWMPQQIPALAPQLQALGFKGNPKAFADLTGQPMGAVVSLGGCTASFVSPDGLIVTNHHCVTGALQYNSTPERNLLRDGFLAKTRDEELSAGPGQHVYITTSFTEVTRAITGNIDPKAADRQRSEIIDRRMKERVAACEMEGMRCNVASFFEGLQYFEIAQLDIRDVRLVYAPAEGIGVFGGETDNWRWPRHTGDWSYYRAYVNKQGRPAAYAKENIPYKPKHWLQPFFRRSWLQFIDVPGGDFYQLLVFAASVRPSACFDTSIIRFRVASAILLFPIQASRISASSRVSFLLTVFPFLFEVQ